MLDRGRPGAAPGHAPARAERFSAAEYDEPIDGRRRPSLRRRLAWYAIGLALVVAICSSIRRPADDFCLGLGRPAAARSSAASSTARSATAIALGDRALPLPPAPLPRRLVVPGRAAQRGRDGVHRRGRVPRRALRPPAADRPRADRSRTSSRRSSTPWRRGSGAPGRDRYMLVLALAIGLAGGWVTVVDRRHRRGVPRPRRSPGSRSSCTTGHAGQPSRGAPRSRRSSKRRRPPEGWRRRSDSRESASRDR